MALGCVLSESVVGVAGVGELVGLGKRVGLGL